MDEQLEFVRLVVSRLEAAGIPYMLTGSIALAVYATPRLTRDVDVVIAAGPEDLILSKLVSAGDTGSEIQLLDVRELLAGASDLDQAYLDSWAPRLGVVVALDRARRA